MKVAKWNPHTQVLYERQKENEAAIKDLLKESKKEAYEEGMEKGREEAKIKSISDIKNAVKAGLDHAMLASIFKSSFTENELTKIETCLLANHECTDESLASELGLIGNVIN